MSGPVVKNYILVKSEENSMQYRERGAYGCPWSFERNFELQCGTSVDCVFITGLTTRGLYAETSKKKMKTRPKVGPRNSERTLESKETDNSARRDSMRSLLELLEEFTEN